VRRPKRTRLTFLVSILCMRSVSTVSTGVSNVEGMTAIVDGR
jgi:hypothetical protein